jgi:glycerophosphoryl diester phosphodiesterase
MQIYKNRQKYSEYIMITAHRGDWRNAPENSLLGMQFCIDKGVDVMETDLKLTKDSVLILMHDETLDRTTTGSGFVKDWTMDSIKTLHLRNGYGEPTPYRVPTLREALVFAKGKILLDLDKSYSYLRLAYNIAKETNTINQTIFRVNDNWEIFNVKFGDIASEIHYMPLVWWNTAKPQEFIANYIHAPYPPLAIEVIYKTADSPQLLAINIFQNVKCRVMMNTVFSRICGGHDDYKALENPDDNWGWIIEHGANVIGTDRPFKMIEYMEGRGLRNREL